MVSASIAASTANGGKRKQNCMRRTDSVAGFAADGNIEGKPSQVDPFWRLSPLRCTLFRAGPMSA